DPETDLAVLRLDAQNLPAIGFGSSDALHVGDVVLAIGNPFGVGQTVTSGIVSALGRTGLGINTFENFIQTDAAINPGNSGGALIDAAGNLVGINTAIFSRSGGSMGIGFAIPVSTAKMVLEQIVKTGSVTRGWIGVEVQEITPAVAESFKLGTTRGALIAGVLRGGPADKAGVKPGDILVEVDGKSVLDPAAMLGLATAPPVRDAKNPTPAELRRRAIHANYRALADMSPAGGYGVLYGPNIDLAGKDTFGEGKVAGDEYLILVDDVSLMVQVPDRFSPKEPCIVTATSSGSRGIYGAIGTSGEWGLKHGCVVAYTDKGTGIGVHDLATNTVNAIDGTRQSATTAGKRSNFTARLSAAELASFN